MIAIHEVLSDPDLMPRWVPSDQLTNFEEALSALLTSHRMGIEDVILEVEELVSLHGSNMTDPAYKRYERICHPVDKLEKRRMAAIRQLARIAYAATLNPEDGLAVLVGSDTAANVSAMSKHRALQKLKASKPRSKMGPYVTHIATDKRYADWTAKELWPEFIELLKSERWDVEETETGVTCFDGNSEVSYMNSSFVTAVSKARKNLI